MDMPFFPFLYALPVFCFPFVFLAIGLPILLTISWLAGSVNRRTIVVTIDYEENRVTNESTVNIMTGTTKSGEEIMIHNSPSVYGWKGFKKTVLVNKKIVPGKTYEVDLYGFSWPYGQNVLDAREL